MKTVSVFAVTMLAACSLLAQDQPSYSRIYAAIEGPGGPRTVVEHSASTVTERTNPDYPNVNPGHLTVWSEKATEGNLTVRGVRLTIVGIEAVNIHPKPSAIVNMYLDEDEAVRLVAAIHTMAKYLSAAQPPIEDGGQRYMRWSNQDGLLFICGSSHDAPHLNITVTRPEHPILNFTLQQMQDVADAINNGLKMTRVE